MTKTILITGATDGIGLLTARKLAEAGHNILVHGRSAPKMGAALSEIGGNATPFLADLSDLSAVEKLAEEVTSKTDTLDILINNAGVLKAPKTKTDEGHDLRFVVNLFAPYKLTNALLPIMPKDGRIVNLSSAAQSTVDPKAMRGETQLADMEAYAQSKLALTVWSQEIALFYEEGPAFIAVNPGSLLATKMVKEGFGIAGHDLSKGADILIEAALGAGFEHASGHYFDNDEGRFSAPHGAASDGQHNAAVMRTLADLLDKATTSPPRLI